MKRVEATIGEVFQIKPGAERFGGMLIVVTEPHSWGIQGYLLSQMNFEATRFKGVAYCRKNWDDLEYVGRLGWMWEPSEENAPEVISEPAGSP